MPSVSNGDSIVFVDPQPTLADEPSSSINTNSASSDSTHPDLLPDTMNSQGSIAAIDMATDQHRRQVTVSVRPTDNNNAGELDVRDSRQDQRQHIAGGQPLPPGSSPMPPAASSDSNNNGGDNERTTRSARVPSLSNLSDYARSMLLHTKQQMDATSGSPPPAHLHVAGPAGDQRYRGGSLDMGSNNNAPVSSSHASSSYSRGTSLSTSPGRSQHHHNSHHRHAHRASLVNGTAMPNGI